MSAWKYTAFDGMGREKRGSVEAASLDDARRLLSQQGLYPQELHAAEAASAHAPVRGKGSRSSRLKAVSHLTRQLSVLVRTGTPLIDALSVLERQLPEGAWRQVMKDVRTRVEEGSSLSSALEQHPGWFDPVARSLVAAGESRGQLADMLERLSHLVRQQTKIRQAFTGAMVYPCLLMCIAVGVVNVMMFFVLPRFEGLFQSLSAPLPPSTRVLMDISNFARERWYIVLGSVIVIGISAKAWLGSDAGRRQIDVAMVKLPGIGKLTRSFATARLARLLGVLLEGKVAMLDALKLTKASAGNSLYVDLIARAENSVTRGEGMASALSHDNLIAPAVVEAVRSGERTGQIGPVLSSLADFLDEDNEVVVKSLTSIIEPVILLALGVVVGFLAVSMFLPLFDLTSAGQGGGQ
ncbi:MAG: type II secretion system F family protein [Phycisphaerales bacterium]